MGEIEVRERNGRAGSQEPGEDRSQTNVTSTGTLERGGVVKGSSIRVTPKRDDARGTISEEPLQRPER